MQSYLPDVQWSAAVWARKSQEEGQRSQLKITSGAGSIWFSELASDLAVPWLDHVEGGDGLFQSIRGA
jgi:hypothetical protein